TPSQPSINKSVRISSGDRVLTIDWPLLFRRLRMRFGQFFRSARHRAEQTEYTPPIWASKLRLSWFRLGLIGIAIFVFTQKQIDFTVSVGKLGVSAGSAPSTAATSVVYKEQTGSPTTVANNDNQQMGVIPSNTTTSPQLPRWSVDQFDVATTRAYINRFERVAQTEEEKYGIPAAAKLAMAILESNAGTNHLAKRNNNHFGSITAEGYYDNAWNNWRAHSEIIKNEFSALRKYSNDYHRWIKALAQTNYSNDATYANKLLAIIDRFNLG
ncbi:MAG: glucosaminidase domain-containing protein, partial [Bacteroidota bacterium]